MGSKQGGHGGGSETKSEGNGKGNWKKREKATSPREARLRICSQALFWTTQRDSYYYLMDTQCA